MILLQMEGFGPGRMWFMPIICIAVCVILFVVFRRGHGGHRGPFCSGRTEHMDNTDNRDSSAIDIINTRYAKGEISKEEYDKMKSDLS